MMHFAIRTPVVGYLLLVVSVAACFGLGRLEALGVAPKWATVLHLAVLASSLGAIAALPRNSRATPLLVFALLARLALFPMGHGDDANRYAWEGLIQLEGYNPYLVAPDAPELESLRTEFWADINHPDKTAIYPPGMQLVFRVVAKVSTDPDFYKIIILLTDGLVVLLLAGLLKEFGRDVRWVLLYAMNPVVLLSFAGEAHQDVFMLLPMLAALWLYCRKQWGWMFFLIGLAFHGKYIALLLWPFLIQRQNWKWSWITLLTIGVPYLFFHPWGATVASLMEFSSQMHYNGSLHHLLALGLDSFEEASRWCGLLTLGGLLFFRLNTNQPLEGGAYMFGLLLLLSPNVHFWYLTWIIPFLCFVPLPAFILWTATITATYYTLGHMNETGEWLEFIRMTRLEYIPVYAVLTWSLLRRRNHRTMYDATLQPEVKTISVILPTLNEEDRLAALLQNLAEQHEPPREVIVADGGSTDRTVEIARTAGAHVVHASRGRGHQIAAAAKEAASDILFIAHADMELESEALAKLRRELNRTGRMGGSLGCRFSSRHPFLWGINCLNHLRAGIGGISFGDQGQFIRRDALSRMGGFPDLSLMEDVELSLRLKHLEKPLYLGHGIRVSPRKWNQQRKLKHALLVISLTAYYMVVRFFSSQSVDTQRLYRKYYPA